MFLYYYVLRKTQETMKTFALPFFNHFGLNLNRKKRVVMKAMRKKLQKWLFADILQNRYS